MTLVLFLLLSFGGMNPFDSLLHSFSAAGTGGFGLYSDSLASFTPYQTWVIIIFLFLFGINFNLYYLILIRRFRSAFRSTELRVYCAIILISVAILCLDLYGRYESFSELLMHSSLQVLSIVTTAGFSTTNFDLWPTLSKSVLLILMFIGGCAGSTAGGIKVSRIIMFFKNCFSELRQMLHPRSVNVLQLDGKKVEKETQTGVSIYLTLYCLCFFGIFFLLSLNGLDFETTFTAVATTFNNVGPGFALVGPMGNFSAYSDFSKIVFSAAMLLGRLEIFPLILALSPSVWMKKR
jgi:trk system potassium uptake protein TrkH